MSVKSLTAFERLVALQTEQDVIMERMERNAARPEDRFRLDLIEDEMMQARADIRREQRIEERAA